MDKDTRSRIQKATQDARSLLEREYASLLEGVFDIRGDGTIAREPGSHLDAGQQLQRLKLVAAVEHMALSGRSAAEAVDAYIREAAFTTLNRFAALKMLESRGLVLECVSKGDESAGFREFSGLAPGLATMPDRGYRLYIESIFDEIGREVRLLFDRTDAHSLLWPSRQALLDLLDVVNDSELAAVWAEDETIGWIYQFFNSSDERRTMRDASQAPRNSRELAVRNQFFTPRYVVQFLAENTLIRVWQSMLEDTCIPDDCEYYVRDAEESKPRAKKDPRDITVLDPACGSGHFLLYAFELFLRIYEEAWGDPNAPASDDTGRTLQVDFPDLEQLRRALPTLIVERNLFGVDIDPRAAQIAALALWMRAQRAYNDYGVARGERAPVRRTHIVIAEPMPGEEAIVEDFASQLEPPLLRGLFKKLVGEMRLAGDLGVLLRIDRDLSDTLTAARRTYLKQMQDTPHLPGMEPVQAQGELDLSGIDDDAFFERAEQAMLEALSRFAESAAGAAGVQRKMFAEDSLQGLALVEIVRTRFDVVLMNPPFGRSTESANDYVRSAYPLGYHDLYCAFVDRGWELLAENGYLGALTSRSGFALSKARKWRLTRLTGESRLSVCADFGVGVLDGAMVEAAAYTITGSPAPATARFFDFRGAPDKQGALRAALSGGVSPYVRRHQVFEALPGAVLAYWLDPDDIQEFADHPALNEVASVVNGSATSDDLRFIRLWWEVPATVLSDGPNVRSWRRLSKGGKFGAFYTSVHLLLDWRGDGGYLGDYMYENRPRNGYLWGPKSWTRTFMGCGGVTWPARSQKGFTARLLPRDCAFTHKSPVVHSGSREGDLALLAALNTRKTQRLLAPLVAFGSWETGAVGAVPVDLSRTGELAKLALEGFENARSLFSTLETDPHFEMISTDSAEGPQQAIAARQHRCERNMHAMSVALARIERVSGAAEQPDYERVEAFGSLVEGVTPSAVVSELFGVAFGRWLSNHQSLEDLTTGRDPFDPLPVLPPAAVAHGNSMQAGELCDLMHDDVGAEGDIGTRLSQAASELWSGSGEDHTEVLAHLLGDQSLRAWVGSRFFDYHLSVYSASKRKAPIYWQLATPSARYSVWLYAHKVDSDSLFRARADAIEPKLASEERKLASLVQEAGPTPTTSQGRVIAEQEAFVEELRIMREEVARIAPLWSPDLHDGIVIAMSPLWRLVPQHRDWQAELKKTFDALACGTYDWAHLAMHLWPERVVPKCASDRSLAITHGLEDVFWLENADGKWIRRTVGQDAIDALVAERTSPAVTDALRSLLEAPVATGGRGRTRQAGGTK